MIALAGIAALGLAIRLIGLERSGLTFDESGRVAVAMLPWNDVLHGVQVIELSPPLYAVLLHAWQGIVGTSDLAARLLSATLILPMVPIAWSLGEAVGGRRLGSAFAMLVALNPLAVHYGQEAAMYALLLCLSLVTTRAAIGALQTDDSSARWWLVTYTASGILAIYTHYYAAFLLIAAGISGLVHFWRLGSFRRLFLWCAAHIIIGVAFLPWLHALLTQARLSAAVDEWSGVITPVIGVLLWSGALLADQHPIWLAVGAPVLVFGCALGGWRLRGRDPAAGLLIAITILPLALALLTDGALHSFRPRGFLAVADGPWLLLVASVVLGSSRRGLDMVARVTLGVALVTATAMGLQHHASEPDQGWSSAAALVAEEGAPDDPVVFLHYALQVPFDRYFALVKSSEPVSWNRPRIGLPESFTWETGYTVPYHVTREDVDRRVGPALAGRSAVWALLPTTDYTGGGEYLLAYLDSRGSRSTDVQFPGVRVVRYRLPPD